MIPFNKAPYIGIEDQYIYKAIKYQKLSGDGYFNKKCEKWFEKKLKCKKALLTPSCTAALEMCALLLDISNDDEIIMPSYTFVSTANAFVLRGAKIVYVDIQADTMNINANKIEQAITDRTKAIVVVHYAGVACEMNKILKITQKYNLVLIEDAAQAMMSSYKNKALGTIGDFGCYSFHETKNYTSGGEGGLLIINNQKFIQRAEIIKEKGTNRNAFFRGDVNKYSWVDLGSSYLMNEISAAYLWAQLKEVKTIHSYRLRLWKIYYKGLKKLEKTKNIKLPVITKKSLHNAHIFYIKTIKKEDRKYLLKHLKKNNIQASFHYIPLHSSIAGKKFGRFNGIDMVTTTESEKLIRLPLFYGLKEKDIHYIIKVIKVFFNEK